MSSPFQKAFMGKDPMKTIKLNDKDLSSTKSASSSKPASIGVEGQGGTDYESPDYNNVEGQGGIDYEAEDYKKKTKVSPLNSYANPGGEIYLSDQPSFQKLQSDIQGAADKVIASASDAKTAKHLQKRIDRRQDNQIVKKGREIGEDKLDNYEDKTTKLQARKDQALLDSENAASSEMAKIQAENERLKKKYEA